MSLRIRHARTYNTPAIVGVREATHLCHDGMRVEVVGNASIAHSV
jgi:phosphohistidine swiveling domain-containing protein